MHEANNNAAAVSQTVIAPLCETRPGSAQSAMTQEAKKQTLNQSMEQAVKLLSVD
jgi:hypothetical protein